MQSHSSTPQRTQEATDSYDEMKAAARRSGDPAKWVQAAGVVASAQVRAQAWRRLH